MFKLYHGDCLEVMVKLIRRGIVVDAILADPPYGTTHCKWDSIIPFGLMWDRINKLIKPNGVIALFGSEPFSSALRMSNIKNYKYDWVWKKNRVTNFLNVKRMPLRRNENISIFYNQPCLYRPQLTKKDPKKVGNITTKRKQAKHYNSLTNKSSRTIPIEMAYPTETLYFLPQPDDKLQHPTQKPVALMEYLVKTYTLPYETVLDFSAGSFTTAIACLNTKRNFIGIELDEHYFRVGKERLKKHLLMLDYKPEVVCS